MICFVSTSNLHATFTSPRTSFDKAVAHLSVVNQNVDEKLNYMHPLAFTTKNSSNDTFTLKEMLKQEDVSSFVEAMTKEVQTHESRDHWTPGLRSDLTLKKKTIFSIWSFKRKRFPDVRLLKHKACLCAHGGIQRGGGGGGLLGNIIPGGKLDIS